MIRWLCSGLTAAGMAVCLPTARAQEAGEDEEVPFHGPDVHPGYPDAFLVSYTLRKNTVSPDGKYGVIFPDRTRMDDATDFLVVVKESRILGVIEFGSEDTYFVGKNHGGLNVYWAPNSSAVLVVSEGKWTPRELMLIELKDGRIVRQTPLFAPWEKAIHAAAPKAAELGRAMVELDLNGVSWKMEKSLLLQLKCDVSTNPKGFSDQSSWSGSVVGAWDIARHEFTQVKVKQTSFSKGGKGER